MSFVRMETAIRATARERDHFRFCYFCVRISLIAERRRRDGERERLRPADRLRPRLGDEGCAWPYAADFPAARLAKYSLLGGHTRLVVSGLASRLVVFRFFTCGTTALAHCATAWALNRSRSVARRPPK